MTCQQHVGELSRHSTWPDGKVLSTEKAIYYVIGIAAAATDGIFLALCSVQIQNIIIGDSQIF